MRHHVARVDIARLVSVFEQMLTTSLCLIQEYYMSCSSVLCLFLVLSVLLIAMCGRLS